MFGCGLVCVGCRNCSGNGIAGSVCLLDRVAIFVCAGEFSCRWELFVIGVPLIP